MPAINESSAIYLPNRMLSQHQAVLTLIKSRIESPELNKLNWLDLACGQGQIIANCEYIFSPECCRKIEYTCVDAIQKYCLQAELIARKVFYDAKPIVCDIDKCFELKELKEKFFDIITLTNSVHEMTPQQIANIFVTSISKLKQEGLMFIYDMESLQNPELGAIPWEGKDIEKVFHDVFRAAGVSAYFPTVAIWPHKTCKGWNIQIERKYLKIPQRTLESKRVQMLDVASKGIQDILERKLIKIHRALSSAARYGLDVGEEQKEIVELLYEYWAISRALNIPLKIPVR